MTVGKALAVHTGVCSISAAKSYAPAKSEAIALFWGSPTLVVETSEIGVCLKEVMVTAKELPSHSGSVELQHLFISIW